MEGPTNGQGSRHELEIELPNDLRAIEQSVEVVLDRGRQVGFNPDRLRLNLRVGLTEALANAMLYGNGQDPRKHVFVEARLSRDEIFVRVTDEGRGFNPASIPDPTMPDRIPRTNGRGIFLIRRLMDHVEYNERGNAIEMRLHSSGERSDTYGA
jgi:serine/threonine-protein kinase RsbW